MRHLYIFLALVTVTSQAVARPQPLMSGMTAQADSAQTAGQNPAGITRLDGFNARLDIFALDSESTWENSINVGGQSTPVSRTKTTSDLVVPNISLVKPLSDKWYTSFSMLAYSVSDDYGDDWVGKYAIQEYDLVFVSAYPSIAYKVNESWSIAASLAASYTSFTQESAVLNLPEPGNPNPGDGDLEIDADGFTVGFGFSTLYEFTDRTRIGFNYQSELDPELDGDLDFDNLTSTTEAILDGAGLLNAGIDVETASPQRASVGVYHEFENRHAATFDVTWIDWSEFKLAEIYVNNNQVTESDFEYDDIWAYIAGYSFPVTDRFMVGVAGVYVPEMVEDENRQLSLRLDEIWGVGLGVEYKFSDRLLFDASVNYIEVGDSPIESDTIDTDLGPATVSGEFIDRELWILQFGVEWGAGPRNGR